MGAPEQAQHQGVFPQSDVYAMGLTIAVLMSWPKNVLLDSHKDIIAKVNKKDYYPEDLRRLFNQMMAVDWQDRPTAAEALQTVKAIIKASYPETHETTQKLL